jgi:hypothetical protein
MLHALRHDAEDVARLICNAAPTTVPRSRLALGLVRTSQLVGCMPAAFTSRLCAIHNTYALIRATTTDMMATI